MLTLVSMNDDASNIQELTGLEKRGEQLVREHGSVELAQSNCAQHDLEALAAYCAVYERAGEPVPEPERMAAPVLAGEPDPDGDPERHGFTDEPASEVNVPVNGAADAVADDLIRRMGWLEEFVTQLVDQLVSQNILPRNYKETALAKADEAVDG